MYVVAPSPTWVHRGVPLGRRALVAGALDTLGLLDRFLWLRAKLRLPVLSVFTYHRIAELSDVVELDPGVAEVNARELEEQLAVIRTHCTMVSLRDVRLFAKGRKLPPNPVMVAFDDGYRDNHDVALPLLERAGVTATFFIATEYPDMGRLFWWDRVALLMHRCRRARVEVAYPAALVLEPRRDPIAAATRVCRAIKRTSGLDIERLWEELERATGASIERREERALAARTIMDWKQIQALRRAGMDVQSHSHSHRVLQTLSPEEATRDLARSRRVLSEALGEAVHAVAYPVGYRLHGAFQRAVREAGFELGFTNNSGLCMLSSFDPLNFPRVAMDRGQVGALFKLKLLIGQRAGCRAGR
ncbi:polysaccharide deacetylase family protein [Sorangium sp. So ce131]|uniref:polysaccharide deacetylase family protein n=1 Tax=Sorangium sp. So ce131 TaxID=3133282 RepID=UPI003F60C5FE